VTQAFLPVAANSNKQNKRDQSMTLEKEPDDAWLSDHPKPWKEADWREYEGRFGRRLQDWLDNGYGSCVLADPDIRQIVEDCLLRFHNKRFWLHAAAIMPNHVHLLLEPLPGYMLFSLLKGIKGASAHRANLKLGKTGAFWLDESYDHIVRSEEQYQYLLRYIAENPTKAGLQPGEYSLYGDTGIPACGGKL
jgi:REP element-mobilizing transposase RayT